MSKRLEEDLQNLKELSLEDLIDKRNLLKTQKLGIDTSISQYDEYPNPCPDWLKRATYASKAITILIQACDIEISTQRQKQKAFERSFYSLAKQTLPTEIFEELKFAANQTIGVE